MGQRRAVMRSWLMGKITRQSYVRARLSQKRR
jgi:hypothetical protein